MKKEKEYKITFTTDYTDYEESVKRGETFWKETVEENPEALAICRKWKGKTIKLSEIPDLVAEVGEVIVGDDIIEIYNDYRE